jgi:hypothetical protein
MEGLHTHATISMAILQIKFSTSPMNHDSSEIDGDPFYPKQTPFQLYPKMDPDLAPGCIQVDSFK